MDEAVNKSSSEEPLILQLAREMSGCKDADRFCFKALKHVCFLLEAEKCSLYYISSSSSSSSLPKKEELVPRLVNVTPDSTIESTLCSSSQGGANTRPITGHVAHVIRTKSPLNISDLEKFQNTDHSSGKRKSTTQQESGDSATAREKRKSTGIRNLLCYPLLLEQESKLIGIVEVVNKNHNKSFTYDDEEVLEHFILLCSLAIANCKKNLQIKQHQQCIQLQQLMMNEITLTWPRMTYDDVIRAVVSQLCQVIDDCERYTLLISLFDCQQQLQPTAATIIPSVDDDQSPPTPSLQPAPTPDDASIFTRAYDVIKPRSSRKAGGGDEVSVEIETMRLKKTDWIFNSRLIEEVIATKKTIILPNVQPFSPYYLEDTNKDFSISNALCMPIYGDGGKRLLGILHLANRPSGFEPNDQSLLESLIPYITCGILYSNSFNLIQMQQAKLEVSEEMLRYHLSPFHDDLLRFERRELTEGCKMFDFKFCDNTISDDETVLMSMKMFEHIDAFNRFKIDSKTMLRWLLTVKKSYREVTYHNWRHGFNVAHTMFLLVHYMKQDKLPYMKTIFTPEEHFCLIVACLCHDVDHRGTNNSFLIRSASPLATLYTTSTLENHHYDNFIRSVSIEQNNIFAGFTPRKFHQLSAFIRQAILATDLGLYFQRRHKFQTLLKTEASQRDFSNPDNKSLLMSMMMTSCDLSQTTKPWDAQYQTAKCVTSEFYDQGDLERKMFGTEPMPMMDRNYADDLAKMQIGFIDGVCSMVYEMMRGFCGLYSPLYEGMSENRKEWVVRADKKKVEERRSLETGDEEGAGRKREKEEEEEEERHDKKYESLWVKYWNADPDNFIWGIDPDVVVPDVVIERVVFSPKRKTVPGTMFGTGGTSTEKCGGGGSSGGGAGVGWGSSSTSIKNTSSTSSSTSSQRRHNHSSIHHHPAPPHHSPKPSGSPQGAATATSAGVASPMSNWTRHCHGKKKKQRHHKAANHQQEPEASGGNGEDQEEKSSKICCLM